ncbi:DUF2567 domain-containing protein [Micromonospora sp. NPDC051006]|uniref:DUF2567 domain-containing protein n=1 Tax=Micromonospora sp. NPDC051006 TaxID=3364283 RepID=UPI0037A8EB7C
MPGPQATRPGAEPTPPDPQADRPDPQATPPGAQAGPPNVQAGPLVSPPGAEAGWGGPEAGPPAWAYPADRTPTAETGSRRRAAVLAVGAGLALAVLGAPLGLLWAAVAPDTPVIKTAEGAVYAQPQPEQPIAADGWFSLLGLGFGVLAALALWFLLRRRRGPVGLVAAVLGAFAAGLVAWQLGRRIGLSRFDQLLASAPEGQGFGKPSDLRAGGIDWVLGVLPVPHGNLLLPAFGAAITYTLLAGWSRWPSLRPEPDAADLSWVSAATPTPPAAPEPPAPGAAEPPRG